MPDYQDCPLIGAPAAGVDQPWPDKDRRRPGRIQNVNPALIPLMRNAAGVPILDDIGQRPIAIDYARLRTLLIRAVSSTPTWGFIALWLVIAAALRLVTGRGTWIAFWGGIILSVCLCIFPSCEV